MLPAIFVSVLDLVPIVGSTIAGVVVAAVAFTVSPLACIAAIVFFIVFRFVEDYLLVPRIIGRAMKVPALITVVMVSMGDGFRLLRRYAHTSEQHLTDVAGA